jgi:site-specific DNA recombinase
MKVAKKKGEIRRVVLYARVSTVEQAERDLSLPAQLDALRRFCTTRGYEIVGEYKEEGASGTDDNRKVFRRMLEDVLAPSKDVQAVLVYQSSRFMRNATKARALKDQLKRRGVRVVAIGQETTDDPMGHIIEGIFELIDQYESEVNGLRTSAAMRENAKQGNFNGARAPYGFSVLRKEIREGIERGTLVPNLSEIETAREIFRLYIAGSGAKAVARQLNQRGLKPRDGVLWRKDMVLKVVDETAVIGTFYWGKRESKTGALRDREDWVAVPCEPIVSRDLFDMAQQVRDSRDPQKHPGRESSSPLLLAGLLKCGRCGASYQLETSGKPVANGGTYRYYNCRSFVRTGKEACPGHRYSTAKLEKTVLEHVGEKLFTPERCVAILKDVVEETGILRQKTNEQRQQLLREVEEIERRIQKWEAAFETGEMPKEAGADRLLALKDRRRELTETLAKVIPLRPPPPHLHSAENIERFRESIRGLFLSGNNAMTRNYLWFLVDRIVLNGTHVELYARTEAAVRVMVSGQKKTEVITGLPVLTSVIEWLPDVDSNHGHGD